MVGRTFANGRYEVLQQLGEGGAALVYRGHDHHLGRDVAIKVLRPELAGDPEFAERFRREATAAAGLCHPHIAQVYDIGWESGLSYMVMELVPGGSLRDRLQRSGALAPDEALRVASEVAAALQHAHESGIVHRDIKPHNILFTRDGSVKVVDFGIARALAQASISQTGTIVGSVHYLSPEQARGEPSVQQSDLYSLGVVLFEMLTGRVPFDADTPVAVAVRHMQDIPPDVRTLNPQIPSAVAAIVHRALAKDPHDRYRNALAMQQEADRTRGALLSGAAPAAGPTLADQATRRIARPSVPPPVHPSLRAARPPIEQPLEPDGLSGLTWALVTLTILVVAAGVGILIWVNLPRHAGGSPLTGPQAGQAAVSVAMPNLRGMEVSAAKNELRRQGIDDSRVRIDYRNSEGTPANTVLDQRPGPGVTWKTGDSVTLTVAQATADDQDKTAPVPDCVGMDVREANKLLTQAKLTPKVEYKEVTGDEVADSVIDQWPSAGSTAKIGTEVRIRVARKKKVEPAEPEPAGPEGPAAEPTGPSKPADGGEKPSDSGAGEGSPTTPGSGSNGGGGNGGAGNGGTQPGGDTPKPTDSPRKPAPL